MSAPAGQDTVLSAQTSLTLLYSGTIDPRVVPTQAVPGTIYLGTGGEIAGLAFIKQDVGSTTNWSLIPRSGTPTPPPPFTQNILYVAPRGNDVSGDGSILNPYKTINRAIAATTDASLSNGYVIMLNPGTYDEHVKLPNFVGLTGTDSFSVFIQPFTTPGPTFIFDATNQENNGVVNVSINAYEGGADPAISIAAGGLCFLQLCFVTGFGPSAAIDCSGFLDSAFGNYINDTTGGGVTVRAGGTYYSVCDTLTPGGGPGVALDILAGGSVVAYAGLTIYGNSLSNAGTLTLQAQSNLTGYTPALVANWSGVAPKSVADALDRIAAKITPIP
jgi:hypothetical protein